MAAPKVRRGTFGGQSGWRAYIDSRNNRITAFSIRLMVRWGGKATKPFFARGFRLPLYKDSNTNILLF
jgi:hypothetical protein